MQYFTEDFISQGGTLCRWAHRKEKKIPVILETFLAFFFSYYILECHELNME